MEERTPEQNIEYFRANPSLIVQDTLWTQLHQFQVMALANSIPTRDGMVFFDALAWTVARIIANNAFASQQETMIAELTNRLADMVDIWVNRLAESERGTVDRRKLN